ncbi:MAG: amidohydrolase family protein [Steroidobacterales bacterium]
MSLLIKGRVLVDGSVAQRTVRIDNGIIVEVAQGDPGQGIQAIALKEDQILVPAAVDTLAAMRDWAEAPRETVETATQAALGAGVTTLCDFCNTVPRLNTPELIRKRSEFVAARSYIDFGISGHPPTDPTQIDRYREVGAFSVQLFPWDLRPWNYSADTDDSARQFSRFAQLGLGGLVFADESALHQTDIWEQGERFAVTALLRRLVPEFKVRVMVTFPESVDALFEAKARLPNLLVQVPMHSILMSRDIARERIGLGSALAPPLRSAETAARMFDYAREGKIDILVSHHAPHRTVDKFCADPIPGELTPKAGYSTLDFTFPLLMTRLGIAQACRLYCENPARHLGVKKGVIAKGYDADLAIVEESFDDTVHNLHVAGSIATAIWRVDPSDFYSKAIVSPFIGEQLNYRVAKTFLRGAEVYDRETRSFKRAPVRQIAALG